MSPAPSDLLNRLAAAERVARGPRLRRLISRPAGYLSATLYTHLLYPRLQRGWRRRASTFFGPTMEVRLPAGQDIFLTGAKTHDSELRLARFLIRRLREGQTFIDVGAHYGFFSLLASTCTGPSGRVLALEASPDTFSVLASNLRGIPGAEPWPGAAADRDGTITFYEFPPLFSEYNSLDRNPFPAGRQQDVRSRPLTVSCRRLDSLLSERDLRPDLVKIDVEGAEALVVEGMYSLLQAEQPPAVVLEYLHPDRDNQPHRQAVELLAAAGYSLFTIAPDGNLLPCPDPDEALRAAGLDSDNLVGIPGPPAVYD